MPLRSSLRALALAAAGVSLTAALAAPGLGPARRLASPAWLGAAAGLGWTLRRAAFRSVPPAALRVDDALSLPLEGGQAQSRVS